MWTAPVSNADPGSIRFRRRVGRGGRVILDRFVPRQDVQDSLSHQVEDPEIVNEFVNKWKFDTSLDDEDIVELDEQSK